MLGSWAKLGLRERAVRRKRVQIEEGIQIQRVLAFLSYRSSAGLPLENPVMKASQANHSPRKTKSAENGVAPSTNRHLRGQMMKYG